MKSVFCIVILILLPTIVNSQSIEIKTGLSTSSYIPFRKIDNHINYRNTGGLGYSFGISYQDSKYQNTFLKGSINVEHYSGHINTSSHFLGYSSSLDATFNKTIIGLDFIPLRLKANDLSIEFGLNTSYLFQRNINGFSSRDTSVNYKILDNKSFKNLYVGLISTFKYDLNISKKLYIYPYINIYAGLTNELIGNPFILHAIRSSIGFGFGRKLN